MFTIAHCLENNWGDSLNRPLFNFLAGEECEFIGYRSQKGKPHIIGIGSILSFSNKFSTVWGAGFIKNNDRLSETPFSLLAVRGPHSRQKLIQQKHSCPEIYGDPALLYPLCYNPNLEEKYEWGFIPHYVDYSNVFFESCRQAGFLVINVRDPINSVVDQLLQCKNIVASSLHGLIAADAYKKSSVWIRLTDKIVGRNFKYHDYFASVGRKQTKAIDCLDKKVKEQLPLLIDNLSNGINLDLRPLLNCCPIIQNKSFKEQLVKRIQDHYKL